MTVEPGDGRGDTAENDAVGDILPNLVLIKTLVGSLMQTRELLVQAVGDGLALTFIDIGGQTDAQDGDDG